MAAPKGEPVGPFPDGVDRDEYDKLRRRVLWTMPYGLYVVGSREGERRNAMTTNWVSQVSFVPKLVAISVENEAFTHQLITEGRVFSVCTIDREDRAIVRKFVKPVEVDAGAGTLNGVAFRERTTGAPVLVGCVSWLDCALRQSVVTGGHTLFIGEVVDCGFTGDEATPVLRMEDTRMNYGG